MAETAKKIEDALRFIDSAHNELKLGNVVTLTDFQKMVESIHNEIAAFPPKNATIYKDKLQQLADAVRIFETDLRQMHGDAKQELISLNQKQNALKKYQTVNHSVPKKDNDTNGN
jgi:hypothetical protein